VNYNVGKTNRVRMFRVLKSEVEELGELEKERDRFYELKSCEMKEFRENVEKFVVECRMRVEELRNRIKEVNN
jgi:coenzyme F420-reducing hydrogenase delta subunit